MVIPTLGQRITLLRETLQSLKDQDSCSFDTVMIFPLSNKDTTKLATEFGATVIDDPGGLSAAVNAGIAQRQPWHQYIGWIGDDDLLSPNSLKTTSSALDRHPDAVVAFGYCDYIDHAGHHLFTSRAGRFAPWIMTWGPDLVPCPGSLFRYTALQEAGDFDVAIKYAMDLDMFLRLRKLGKFINTGTTLASFRWHPESSTVANRARQLKETEAVKRRYLPKPLRLIAPAWEIPVRYATRFAAHRLNVLARQQ
jgi:GT2 family glycosyltransferase